MARMRQPNSRQAHGSRAFAHPTGYPPPSSWWLQDSIVSINCCRRGAILAPRRNICAAVVSVGHMLEPSRGIMLIRKILIMGLPGAGKTTLATALAPLLNAVVFNA